MIREEKSEQINELAKALSALQAKLEGAKKDSSNPFFKSKYADLESIWESVRPLLEPNGLSVAQTMDYVLPDDSQPVTILVTTLMHSSGQFICGAMPLFLKQADPQGQGSAITYARRYCLAAILGIHQTDDDAEATKTLTEHQTITRVKPPAAPLKAPSITSDAQVTPIQMNQLLMVGKANGWSREQISDFVASYFKLAPKTTLTINQWAEAKTMISNPQNADGAITVNAKGLELFANV